MLKQYCIICLLLLTFKAYPQATLPISPDGIKLQKFYLGMGVENNWLAGHHVVWDKGTPDMPESKHGNKTHCSAFAAAVCKKLGVYLLCPPEHGQILLANAQFAWLQSIKAQRKGWEQLLGADRYRQAQELANNGKIVIAVYQNTDTTKPGHIALIMPVERSLKLLENQGPELIMAGTHNHNYISLKNGFASHIASWPENDIVFYVMRKEIKMNN